MNSEVICMYIYVYIYICICIHGNTDNYYLLAKRKISQCCVHSLFPSVVKYPFTFFSISVYNVLMDSEVICMCIYVCVYIYICVAVAVASCNVHTPTHITCCIMRLAPSLGNNTLPIKHICNTWKNHLFGDHNGSDNGPSIRRPQWPMLAQIMR